MSSSAGELSACECPVCFHLLTGERSPLSLPCGHTLCKVCIEQLTAQGAGVDTFPCPLCRKPIKTESVSLNLTLKNLIDELLKDGSRGVHGGSSALNVPYDEITFKRTLDRGAFGEVYCGLWRGNEVAIKVFTSGQMTRESLQAFRREVFVMNCLRHPNVVLLMGACQTPPKLAILMEYVPGGSLYKVLHVDKVSLSLEGICSVAGGICRGLQYLHSINIVHRDLKSKNVLLSSLPPLCQAKLCDFGMARMRLESATMTGNVGTVHWTAPEVMANQRYQFPADVYSLGMVLYEMATGQIPFQELLPVAVMMAVAINKQQPDVPAHVLPAIAALIRRCVCWEAGSRPPIADILSVLTSLMPSTLGDTALDQQPDFSHTDSLGMVFLSVSDSTDVGVEVQGTSTSPGVPGYQNTLDSTDRGVPGYQNTLDSTDRGVPGYQNTLDSADRGAGSKEEKRTLVTDQELAKQLESEARGFQMAQDEHLAEQLQLKENSYWVPSDLVPKVSAMPSPQQMMKGAKNVTKKKKYTMESAPIPFTPPPPPPPPPPPLPTPPYVRLQKLQLMKQVKHYGTSMKYKLRPVQSVEKRAFPVGRVVGTNVNRERELYTFQNLIKNFSKRLLNHVVTAEPEPPFPVGKVVSNRRGNVMRLSSMYGTSLRPKLPDQIQSELITFPKSSLQQIIPKVSNLLPSKTDISEEKRENAEEGVDGFW